MQLRRSQPGHLGVRSLVKVQFKRCAWLKMAGTEIHLPDVAALPRSIPHPAQEAA